MTEFEFKRVKRPLLRDPSAPHDQMDNFGTREAAQLQAKQHRMVTLKKVTRVSLPGKALSHVEMRDVKLPWGW